jgi:hypothetical protein
VHCSSFVAAQARKSGDFRYHSPLQCTTSGRKTHPVRAEMSTAAKNGRSTPQETNTSGWLIAGPFPYNELWRRDAVSLDVERSPSARKKGTMNVKHHVSLITLSALFFLFSQVRGQESVKLLHQSHGLFPVSELKLLPEGQRDARIGYIADEKTFERVWRAFKPKDETPKVNFKDDIVLFVRNIKYVNSISNVKVSVKDAQATITFFETRTAVEIKDQLHLAMVVVPRNNIRSLRWADRVIDVPAP